jgi:hypothetical protein
MRAWRGGEDDGAGLLLAEERQGGQLVAQGLAAAGGQDDQGPAAAEDGLDRLALKGAVGEEVEVLEVVLVRRGERHGGLAGEQGGRRHGNGHRRRARPSRRRRRPGEALCGVGAGVEDGPAEVGVADDTALQERPVEAPLDILLVHGRAAVVVEGRHNLPREQGAGGPPQGGQNALLQAIHLCSSVSSGRGRGGGVVLTGVG